MSDCPHGHFITTEAEYREETRLGFYYMCRNCNTEFVPITDIGTLKAENAALKAENGKLRAALSIVHFKQEPLQ